MKLNKQSTLQADRKILGVTLCVFVGTVYGGSAEAAQPVASAKNNSSAVKKVATQRKANAVKARMAANQRESKKRAAASLLSSPQQPQLDQYVPPTAPSFERSPSPIDTNRGEEHHSARRLLQAGTRHHKAGNCAEAERLFRAAVAADPHNADGFFNLGALAEGRGDNVTALGHYRAGLHIQPNDPALKDAVSSIEARLAAGEGIAYKNQEPVRDNFNHPPLIYSDPQDNAPVLGVNPTDTTPILNQYSDDRQPILPVNNNGPFQLHSAQNATTLDPSTGMYANSPFSVNTSTGVNNAVPPVIPVVPVQSRARRASGAAFSAILNIGLSAALRGSGLHCPACRILRF